MATDVGYTHVGRARWVFVNLLRGPFGPASDKAQRSFPRGCGLAWLEDAEPGRLEVPNLSDELRAELIPARSVLDTLAEEPLAAMRSRMQMDSRIRPWGAPSQGRLRERAKTRMTVAGHGPDAAKNLGDRRHVVRALAPQRSVVSRLRVADAVHLAQALDSTRG